MTLMRTAAIGVVVSLAAAFAGCEMFKSHGDAKLFAEAKITSDAARAIALKAQPGTVKEWELEKEAGGSGLRYSFDILNSGVIHEIGVDAADGKILENAVETAEDEAREAREEGKDKDDDH